jgi:hypothetical protein
MTSMSLDHNPHRKRVVTYVILGAVVLILALIALLIGKTVKTNRTAEQRAAQLQTAFATAGLPVPSTTQITRVLGDDGGAMCTDPANALHQANLNAQLANGAGGPGTRPTTVDGRVIQGELLAIGIYCPEQLADFTNYIKGLKFDDVAG